MDEILKAVDKIVDVFQYLNREQTELNCEKSQVSKILKELLEEIFTSNQQTQPEICPVCKGTGYSENFRGPDYGYQCENCNGTCKVKTT